MKNKKIRMAILSIIALAIVTITVTYAYWLVTKNQKGNNQIYAGCLDFSITGEKNNIHLEEQFPTSDEDGMKLTPYEFTVSNNCFNSLDYQIALEIFDYGDSISPSSIKIALDDKIYNLGDLAKVKPTISGASESRILAYLKLGSIIDEYPYATHTLRLWIDEDAPISEMNKMFQSKISVSIGQGVENPYEEGTLAYNIIGNQGGEGFINAQSAKWTEGDESAASTNSLYLNTSDSYYFGTKYTFDEKTGKYTLSGDLVQATLAECRNNSLSNGTPITCSKYTLKSTDSIYSNTTLYEVTDFKTSGNSITVKYIKGTNEFSEATSIGESGVYKTKDDLGVSYYFRGAAANNYVEFGSYSEKFSEYRGYNKYGGYKVYETLEACNSATSYNLNCAEYKYAEVGDPMYWRIVRINGDGTIRLVYDGPTKVENGTTHEAEVGRAYFNKDANLEKYAGYTYDDGTGTQVDSTIKGVVDAWYDKYLEANYGTYIADGIFCNDRNVTEYDEVYADWELNPTTYIEPIYGAMSRLQRNRTPSLKCTNKTDRYTMDDTENGNGILSNPVGLLTADEVAFAGAAYLKYNSNFYLETGTDFWTSSPSGWMTSMGLVCMHFYYKDMGLSSINVADGEMSVRPVINLKADVEFTGGGTIDNPYKIVTE